MKKRRTTWIKITEKKSYKTNIKIKEATKRRDCWPGSAVQRKTRQNNEKTGFSFQFILTNIKKYYVKDTHFFV